MNHTLLSTLVAVLLIGGAAMADTAEIKRSITDIAAGADRGDWDRVRSAFAETVIADYTSLWGRDPATQPADELVAGCSSFLPSFDNTHHMLTNHTITPVGEPCVFAEAHCTVTYRIDDGLWTLGRRYTYEVEQPGDR